MSLSNLSELEKKFSKTIQSASTLEELEKVRRDFLGRNGLINSLLKEIVKLPPSERKKTGNELNLIKSEMEKSIAEKISHYEQKKISEKLKSETEDYSLPSYPFISGKLHPLTQVMNEAIKIFLEMGFNIAEGPEIESDENNFNALNIPADHPARDMHDTFYIANCELPIANLNPRPAAHNPQLLLRTHTSPVQIRVMRNQPPPIRMIAPGKVYRHEAIDATHSSVFHQIEGLAVDQAISFADLKGTLELFNQRFFGQNVQTRFRPSYFPFVEPGAEVDISCTICSSDRLKENLCPVCKGTGWIEMLGAGMVHPNVFKAVGYDPEKVTGFAFGMGIERMAMIRYGIQDMRLFYENHLDFLEQF